MSRHELVEAYLRGDMSRRTFVRRLVGAGVSLTAALAYADLVRPGTAQAASRAGDFYELYEDRRPPGAITGQATDVGTGAATLHATVDPNLQTTQVTFEYGVAGGPLGAATAQPVTVEGNGDRDVTAQVAGLLADTAYDFRVVAVNGSGTTTGEVVRFTTARAPAPAPPAAQVATVPPADRVGPLLGLTVPAAKLRTVLRSRELKVTVRSDEAARVTLAAVATVTPKRRRGVRRPKPRQVTVLSGAASVSPARPAEVKLKLTRAGRSLLKDRTSATLSLRSSAVDAAGNRREARQALKLTK